MKVHLRQPVFSCSATIARLSIGALLLCSQLACSHAGYGGRAFGEVPLGSPVEDYLRSSWDDFESLDQAERSGELRLMVDSDGMRTVRVPAAEVGFEMEVGGVRPTFLTMSLHDGRIISAGCFFQGENLKHTIAIALELYHRICDAAGRGPKEFEPLMYRWQVGKRNYIMGLDLDLNQVAWGVVSQKMLDQAVEASKE